MGEYEVVVGDEEYRVSHQILLTGNAVAVSDFRDVGIFKSYSIVWIFLIVVIGGIGSILFVRYRKTRTLGENEFSFKKLVERIKGRSGADKLQKKSVMIGKKINEKIPTSIKSHMNDSLNFTNKSPASQGLNPDSNGNDGMVDFTRKGSLQAESTLVLQGEKHMSAVVALSIKDYEGLSDVARNSLKEIVENSKGKGVVDYRSDYIFVLFNPLVTRTYGNESLATRCGMKIVESLNNYNKKFRDKITFGLGVHAGELIVAKEKGKLKYTGIGNAISFAKRMSDVDSGKVVVSDIVKKKLLRELRVLKGKEIGESPTYVVVEVKNKAVDAAKLKELLARSK
jgi:class 3 adenylate cyclase